MAMLFLLCCVVSLLYLASWYRRRKPEDPPLYPGYLPLIGHAHLLVGDGEHLWKLTKQLARCCLDGSGVVTFWIGTKRFYALTDPEDCLKVSNTCFDKERLSYEISKPILGDSLLISPTATWKRHRKLLHPAFNQQILDGFMDIFNSQAKKLVHELKGFAGNSPFDHSMHLQSNGLETICLTALGLDIAEDVAFNEEYIRALHQLENIIFERIKKFWLHGNYCFKWSSLKKKQDESVKIMHGMAYKAIQRKKVENKNNNLDRKDTKVKLFMDLILELGNGIFTDTEVADEVNSIIAAGHDTSACVLTYTLLLLGSYPEVQEKVYAELQQVFDTERDVEKQDLSRLVYMEAVLKEAMRYYAIAPIIVRQIDKEVQLKNHTLRAGSGCVLLLCGIHRHSIWGPDVEEFNPERWLDPTKLPENLQAFGVFSIGRRNCIGKSFAMMTMKTTLVHLLRRYKIYGDHTNLKMKLEVMMKPVSGHHISIENRYAENY